MQVAKMEVKIRPDKYQPNTYWAEIYIMRECYSAQASTEEVARERLKEHLINIIPIYENDIWVAQEKIKAIKEFLSKSPDQGLV